MNQQFIKKAGHLLAMEWKARKRTHPHETPRMRGWILYYYKQDLVRFAKQKERGS